MYEITFYKLTCNNTEGCFTKDKIYIKYALTNRGDSPDGEETGPGDRQAEDQWHKLHKSNGDVYIKKMNDDDDDDINLSVTIDDVGISGGKKTLWVKIMDDDKFDRDDCVGSQEIAVDSTSLAKDTYNFTDGCADYDLSISVEWCE